MAKILNPSDIAKDLFIVDQFIDNDGLTIQYIYQGKELEISLDIYAASQLLSKYGIVPDANSKGQVLVEYDDEFFKWMDFYEYAKMNRLDERTAHALVCGEEAEKSTAEAIAKVRSIPSLFDTIFANLYSPTKPAL